MRVKLELHRDDYKSSIIRSSLGPYRSLMVTIGGRQFAAWVAVDDSQMYDQRYIQFIDDQLVRQFEYMMERLFNIVAATVPYGLDLVGAKDEELRDALVWQSKSQMMNIPKAEVD
jgi:hypothetical protein